MNKCIFCHVHLHVFPRFKGDGFGLKFSPEYYTRRPEREDLDQVAGRPASGLSESFHHPTATGSRNVSR